MSRPLDRLVLTVAWCGRIVRRTATVLARVETALVAARDSSEPEWRVEATVQHDGPMLECAVCNQRRCFKGEALCWTCSERRRSRVS